MSRGRDRLSGRVQGVRDSDSVSLSGPEHRPRPAWARWPVGAFARGRAELSMKQPEWAVFGGLRPRRRWPVPRRPMRRRGDGAAGLVALTGERCHKLTRVRRTSRVSARQQIYN